MAPGAPEHFHVSVPLSGGIRRVPVIRRRWRPKLLQPHPCCTPSRTGPSPTAHPRWQPGRERHQQPPETRRRLHPGSRLQEGPIWNGKAPHVLEPLRRCQGSPSSSLAGELVRGSRANSWPRAICSSRVAMRPRSKTGGGLTANWVATKPRARSNAAPSRHDDTQRSSRLWSSDTEAASS